MLVSRLQLPNWAPASFPLPPFTGRIKCGRVWAKKSWPQFDWWNLSLRPLDIRLGTWTHDHAVLDWTMVFTYTFSALHLQIQKQDNERCSSRRLRPIQVLFCVWSTCVPWALISTLAPLHVCLSNTYRRRHRCFQHFVQEEARNEQSVFRTSFPNTSKWYPSHSALASRVPYIVFNSSPTWFSPLVLSSFVKKWKWNIQDQDSSAIISLHLLLLELLHLGVLHSCTDLQGPSWCHSAPFSNTQVVVSPPPFATS